MNEEIITVGKLMDNLALLPKNMAILLKNPTDSETWNPTQLEITLSFKDEESVLIIT